MLEFDGLKLKQLRKERGLLQKDVAVAVGKKQGHIANYENNVADPPADTLLSLLHFFKIAPTKLAKSDN
jgi:transcriptional regulator with XRE-family HTH domain